MINKTIDNMIMLIESLKQAILDDIADVKSANHESLLDRNDLKLTKMEELAQLKIDLNSYLMQALQNNEDVDQYRDKVNILEENLIELSKLNRKLGAIVLPVKEMYKEILDDIARENGGSLIEVRA